ncbi:hypothetical protein F0562_001139 [Nyssa sinensis]|uniref:Uncharacterized protein n=1 Tax=Nyssa sinensis TaxID=561372 RepID=A0A5J5C230_9ASTE|nr:hypothetical protein F0562_001139 [Nyssa sinensis]
MNGAEQERRRIVRYYDYRHIRSLGYHTGQFLGRQPTYLPIQDPEESPIQTHFIQHSHTMKGRPLIRSLGAPDPTKLTKSCSLLLSRLSKDFQEENQWKGFKHAGMASSMAAFLAITASVIGVLAAILRLCFGTEDAQVPTVPPVQSTELQRAPVPNDIKAQSTEGLTIDIKAQSTEGLTIDIKAQSTEGLTIDIKAQSTEA